MVCIFILTRKYIMLCILYKYYNIHKTNNSILSIFGPDKHFDRLNWCDDTRILYLPPQDPTTKQRTNIL